MVRYASIDKDSEKECYNCNHKKSLHKPNKCVGLNCDCKKFTKEFAFGSIVKTPLGIGKVHQESNDWATIKFNDGEVQVFHKDELVQENGQIKDGN